ncbi:hypothetical protein PP175_26475 (plasmid) [Aneurinibacillus sp. Ricciae_BoGa-3]|uniref:hypothetical protein n=1 Tax=Aneurinibacillus sp. Ricciae_BoGa-3 TaxID=3022697 RepID=UPI002340AB29|nr:hypothetical protein [Aneurinibacillus sp. Ricciae_BoGa-3]WCK57611.1 hypothetical protein PP175_26475 [Aneurinibacillus sp. Ricciae_BoGa-3]
MSKFFLIVFVLIVLLLFYGGFLFFKYRYKNPQRPIYVWGAILLLPLFILILLVRIVSERLMDNGLITMILIVISLFQLLPYISKSVKKNSSEENSSTDQCKNKDEEVTLFLKILNSAEKIQDSTVFKGVLTFVMCVVVVFFVADAYFLSDMITNSMKQSNVTPIPVYKLPFWIGFFAITENLIIILGALVTTVPSIMYFLQKYKTLQEQER